jgi:hypothetical protein
MAGAPFPLPPLNLNGGMASAGMDTSGGSWSASDGNWTVNVAGSGTAMQSASGGIPWLWIAAGVAAWYFLRK